MMKQCSKIPNGLKGNMHKKEYKRTTFSAITAKSALHKSESNQQTMEIQKSENPYA